MNRFFSLSAIVESVFLLLLHPSVIAQSAHEKQECVNTDWTGIEFPISVIPFVSGDGEESRLSVKLFCYRSGDSRALFRFSFDNDGVGPSGTRAFAEFSAGLDGGMISLRSATCARLPVSFSRSRMHGVGESGEDAHRRARTLIATCEFEVGGDGGEGPYLRLPLTGSVVHFLLPSGFFTTAARPDVLQKEKDQQYDPLSLLSREEDERNGMRVIRVPWEAIDWDIWRLSGEDSIEKVGIRWLNTRGGAECMVALYRVESKSAKWQGADGLHVPRVRLSSVGVDVANGEPVEWEETSIRISDTGKARVHCFRRHGPVDVAGEYSEFTIVVGRVSLSVKAPSSFLRPGLY